MSDSALELPRAVAIVGPTAAGKSALALALAERFSRPILCCDSVQVYRELDIGSAKPSAADRARAQHELLDLVDPDQEFSAGEYGRLAREQLEHGPAIFCGGTGLYLRAAGWTHSGHESDTSEARKPDRGADEDHGPAREAFEREWFARESSDPGALHRTLRERDPETAAGIHPNNLHRLLRALWLCELHQAPVSEVRRRDPPRALLDLLLIVVDPGVSAVDAAIDRRCEAMLREGWVAEVENLLAAGYDARHKAMRSLGYREILDHLTSPEPPSLDATTRAIQSATRKYARRQRTFFRHQFRDLLPMDRIVQLLDVAHLEQPAGLHAALAAGGALRRVEEFLS